jgi:hypothetical protein
LNDQDPKKKEGRKEEGGRKERGRKKIINQRLE